MTYIIINNTDEVSSKLTTVLNFFSPFVALGKLQAKHLRTKNKIMNWPVILWLHPFYVWLLRRGTSCSTGYFLQPKAVDKGCWLTKLYYVTHIDCMLLCFWYGISIDKHSIKTLQNKKWERKWMKYIADKLLVKSIPSNLSITHSHDTTCT